MNKPENTAAELAANFQVEELEPRLENAWSAEGMSGVPSSEDKCPDYDC